MEISNLYKYDSYLVPNLNFLLSTYIREYDITKANISILRRYGYINNSEYTEALEEELKGRMWQHF